jgi:hypothetical protein
MFSVMADFGHVFLLLLKYRSRWCGRRTAYEIVYAGPSLAAATATIRDLFAQSVVALRMRPI